MTIDESTHLQNYAAAALRMLLKRRHFAKPAAAKPYRTAKPHGETLALPPWLSPLAACLPLQRRNA
jgi:hypothetical protein